MSDFNSLVQYTVENISRPVKYIIYKLTEFIRVVDKFVFRQLPSGAASGYATIEKVEGNTVKFNQLCKHTLINWKAKNKLDYDSDTDIIAAKSTASGILFQANELPPLIGHVFYVSLEYKASTSITFSCYSMPTANTAINFGTLTAKSSFTRVAKIATRSTSVAPTENWALSMYKNQSDTGLEIKLGSIFLADLTAIFGAGNEPTTVADFEAWMAQNGLPSVANYNAGELLSVKMSGMQTQDSSQQTIDTLPFDVTTITGINTATNVREVIFPNGMKQADYAGTVKDTLDLRSDTATVKCGIVDLGDLSGWQYRGPGFPSVLSIDVTSSVPYKHINDAINYICDRYTSYITVMGVAPFYDNAPNMSISFYIGAVNTSIIYVKDNSIVASDIDNQGKIAKLNGVYSIYELATPITYTDLQDANGNPLNPRYKVEQGGTEQVLPVNTSTPTTVAPTLTTTYTKDNN